MVSDSFRRRDYMKTKKLLATLLSLTFAVCSLPAFALADGGENGNDIEVTDEDSSAVSPEPDGPDDGEDEDEPDEHLLTYNASIQDDGIIGLNYYLYPDDDGTVIEGAYMEFTITDLDGGEPEVQTSEGTYVEIEGGPGEITTFYKYTVYITAKDMSSNITADLIADGEVLETYEYSLAQYLNAVMEDSRYSDYFGIVSSLLDYGTYAQKYFGHNLNELANGGEFNNDVSKVTTTIASSSQPYINDVYADDNISYYGASLSLKSTTVLSLYFANQSGSDVTYDVTVYSDDITWEKVEKNGYDVIVFSGYTVPLLNEKVSVTVNNGTEDVLTVSYRPLSYVYVILNKPTDGTYTEELKNLVRSLYIFYDEVAKVYGVPGYNSPF